MVWVNGLLSPPCSSPWSGWASSARLRSGVFLGDVVESFLYAMLIGPIAIATLTGELHVGAFRAQFIGLSGTRSSWPVGGAVRGNRFRVVVLGLIFYLAKELGKLNASRPASWRLVLRAIFSAMHFLSADEAVSMSAFIYRLAAGMTLASSSWRAPGQSPSWATLYDGTSMCFTAQ